MSEEFDEWHKTNGSWYQADHDTTVYANGFAAAHPELRNLPEREFLAQVEGAVKKAFPGKFENPNRAKAAAVDAGSVGAGARGPRPKGFDSLPQEARQVADKYVAQGLFKSRADYAKTYFESEGE